MQNIQKTAQRGRHNHGRGVVDEVEQAAVHVEEQGPALVGTGQRWRGQRSGHGGGIG